MGIKGIYEEIGPGKRVALSKLAVDKFEETGRPLRIAIDLSIWQFQIQSGQGGANPALRTLYYRLLKLVSLSIQPLFIFDGPKRPAFKRNRRIQTGSNSVLNSLTQKLLDLFAFPHYVAPGEAEAECALLQRAGIVDGVLTEDVDVLMFGCGLSLRNWSNEGTRGTTPTHISVYDANEIAARPNGLVKEDMILIAMMSGGDYLPGGIPGCGIKIAREAAKAGFGKSLCKISRHDRNALRDWKERLAHELYTNEFKFFRSKHRALQIPDGFPDEAVLRFYTNPETSSSQQLVDRQIRWDGIVNISSLRTFVAETFEWRQLSGAKKFIRGLAPALLVRQLSIRGQSEHSTSDDAEATKQQEERLVKCILGTSGAPRTHFSTDGTEELRIAYVPLDMVGLDLEAEEVDSVHEESHPVNGDEIASFSPESENEVEEQSIPQSPSKRKLKRSYDPAEIDRVWILKTFVKIGVPLTYQDWEAPAGDARQHIARKEAAKRATARRKKVKGDKTEGMAGAMDRYVKITKPVSVRDRYPQSEMGDRKLRDDALQSAHVPSNKPKAKGINNSDAENPLAHEVPLSGRWKTPPTTEGRQDSVPISISSDDDSEAEEHLVAEPTNPWTMAKRPAYTYSQLPEGASYPALGIFPPLKDGSKVIVEEKSARRHNALSEQPNSLLSPPLTPAGKRRSRARPEFKGLSDNLLSSDTARKGRRHPVLSSDSSQKNLDSVVIGENKVQDRGGTPWKERKSKPVNHDPSPAIRPDSASPRDEGPLPHHHAPQNTRAEDDADLPSSPTLPPLSSLLSTEGNSSSQHVTCLSVAQLPVERNNWKLTDSAVREKVNLRRKGRMVALRSSLEGSWKEVDEVEAQSRSQVWREEDIDHVDLVDV